MACLSSRIPHGEAVTPGKLAMIEQAEEVLRELGFYDVRVRHHELSSGSRVSSFASAVAVSSETRNPKLEAVPALARIEVGTSELPRLLQTETRDAVATALKNIGYVHVTVDLQGYRRGGLNVVPPVAYAAIPPR
jgi:uncharacterized protein